MTMTALAEINRKAHAALRRELGPADYTRFLQQFGTAQSDYTHERQTLPEESAEAVHLRTLRAREAGLLVVPEKARALELNSGEN